ncbi:hypothetical protein AB1399_02705, partial [Hydrogenibacillus schlegelii]
FRGRKTGRKVGHPKFRRKHDRRDSFRLDNSSGTIRLLLDGLEPRHPGKARHIILPRFGAGRLNENPFRRTKCGVVRAHRPQGRLLPATGSREAARGFVSLPVEEESPDPPPPKGPAAGSTPA